MSKRNLECENLKVILRRRLNGLKVNCVDEKIETLLGYMNGVLLWNDKVNLTNILNENDFVKKHYIDSLSICSENEFLEAEHIIDVGTGGGFPGIPLAIYYPEKKFTLLDSLKKRLKIVDELCMKLEIKNVKTVHNRAEDLGRDAMYREQFDLCVSRAVANLTSLSELCLPLIKIKGYFISYKGPAFEKELQQSEKAVAMLGGRVKRIVETKNSETAHKLIIIEKIENTNSIYPRKSGIPVKKPLV